MQLTPVDRLRVHLALYHPKLKVKNITLSMNPGFLNSTQGIIDIRGAGYGKDSSSMRLWNELHSYFCHHVDIIKRKNNHPTLILWNGNVYHLDQQRSHRPRREVKRGARLSDH